MSSLNVLSMGIIDSGRAVQPIKVPLNLTAMRGLARYGWILSLSLRLFPMQKSIPHDWSPRSLAACQDWWSWGRISFSRMIIRTVGWEVNEQSICSISYRKRGRFSTKGWALPEIIYWRRSFSINLCFGWFRFGSRDEDLCHNEVTDSIRRRRHSTGGRGPVCDIQLLSFM